MDIVRLPHGAIAPEDTDCIKITAGDDGRYLLVTSALLQCDDDDALSEAVISSDSYASYDEAEEAGLAWANDHCVRQIYVETA